jgi:hypothetical protein
MESTKKALIPTAYWGNIEYFAYLVQYDCTIEVKERFVKQSLRSRCEILGANKVLRLNVPRNRKNSSRLAVDQIGINYDHPWQKEHWQSLCSAYRSSPYFEYYEDEMEELFLHKADSLLELNNLVSHKIIELLDLEIELQFSERYETKFDGLDLRAHSFNNISPPSYTQVFSHPEGFQKNLSILDLLFNEGPNSETYLREVEL